MPHAFDYAIVRIVPHEERGEFINAGVILYCRALNFLQARIQLDMQRLIALAGDIDIDEVKQHLDAIPRICAGGSAAGSLGELSQVERFRWLTSPRNTIIQMSPVHSGLTDNPAATLEHLITTMVAAPVQTKKK